ncbi:MAG TPA: flagellar biosynthetic protein FliR [Tepidisphaeraceae bacterium]|nr:flagellar biosynthetic protein FliR [Tepidisphaeraceae bacterium]
MIQDLLNFVPVYVLVLVRVAAMMLFAPILGSSRIPKRVKGLLAIMLAMGLASGVTVPPVIPESLGALTVGIAGEIVFGLSMGIVMSMSFIAAQWAGEIIGQQMGLQMAEVFDPQYGSQGSLVGDMYYMLATVTFLSIGGHQIMIRAVGESFRHLPLLSVGMNAQLFELLIGLVQASAVIAFRLAAPVLVTMLVVDLALGLIGKAMPQFNVMAAGMTLRSAVGIFIVIVGLGLTSEVIRDSTLDNLDTVVAAFRGTV